MRAAWHLRLHQPTPGLTGLHRRLRPGIRRSAPSAGGRHRRRPGFGALHSALFRLAAERALWKSAAAACPDSHPALLHPPAYSSEYPHNIYIIYIGLRQLLAYGLMRRATRRQAVLFQSSVPVVSAAALPDASGSGLTAAEGSDEPAAPCPDAADAVGACEPATAPREAAGVELPAGPEDCAADTAADAADGTEAPAPLPSTYLISPGRSQPNRVRASCSTYSSVPI